MSSRVSALTFMCPACGETRPDYEFDVVKGTDGREVYCPACEGDFVVGECDACGEGPNLLRHAGGTYAYPEGEFCFHCLNPEGDR